MTKYFVRCFAAQFLQSIPELEQELEQFEEELTIVEELTEKYQELRLNLVNSVYDESYHVAMIDNDLSICKNKKIILEELVAGYKRQIVLQKIYQAALKIFGIY